MSRNAHAKPIFRLLAPEFSPGAGRLYLIASALGLLLLTLLRASASDSLPLPGPAGASVFIVENPRATVNLQPRPEVVADMLRQGVTALTGEANPNAAWLRLVSTQDVVGLKVYSAPGPNSGTRPAVVAAVIEGLLSAGLPPTNIVIWDKHAVDLRLSGFYALAARYRVRIASSINSGYDTNVFYESSIIGNLVWGDLEFGKQGPAIGRKSHLTRLLTTDITKTINIAPLLNHNEAGVSGTLYSLTSGSVDNFFRFESDRTRLATAVPEIYGTPELADRVALNIIDALLCQYEGGERSLLHYSTALNQLWLSRDPVALDVRALQELERQRKLAGASAPKSALALYQNASLLELGTSDPKLIREVHVPIAASR